MMKEIELFPHNEEAYESLVEKTKISNFAFLERATGTGKSFILIKYMAMQLAGKRILFVTLHEAMFNQLAYRDMPSLGTSSDIYEKLDCTLYSSINKKSAKWYYDNYDFFIFDEAHHCGAAKWGETIAELRDLVRESHDKKMIGVTATATRYLDNYVNVGDVYFDGSLCSKLGITEAILREILPAPYYINVSKEENELISSINRKLQKLKLFSNLDPIRDRMKKYSEEYDKRYNIPNLIKKHGVQPGEKYIIFCPSIDDIRRKKEEVKEWFKGMGPLEIYECHSRRLKQDNFDAINDFEKSDSNNLKLMFTVDMFNEGFHVKGVDGLFLARKTSSPILYLQQIGRALSFSARKKQIKIFDLEGNATSIQIIYELYKELLTKAKEMSLNGNDNKHLREIVQRFKIIDEGTERIDELEEIRNYIEDNFIKKEKIDSYIQILKLYCNGLSGNFMDLLKQNKVEKSYLDVYDNLVKMYKYLKFEHFIQLNEIGVIVCEQQRDSEILEKIKSLGNIFNVEKKHIDDFFASYNLFYLKNGRRPSSEFAEELSLYVTYRSYIQNHNRKQIKKYLKDAPYKLNVEELLILDDYPTKKQIDEYLDYVSDKYAKGIKVDELENATLKRIYKRQLCTDNPVFDFVVSNVVFKIDKQMEIISEYLLLHSDEVFADIALFKNNAVLYNALKYLHRYCEHVTNTQFEKLLNMGITLPKKINMTLDERKALLGDFQSIYDKKVADRAVATKRLVRFITDKGRRPLDILEEKEFYDIYHNLFYGKATLATRNVARVLLDLKIDLTIEEKLACNMGANDNENILIYNNIVNSLKCMDLDNFYEIDLKRKANYLYRAGYIDERLLKIFTRTIILISKCLNLNESNRSELKKYLANNISIIPYGLSNFLLTNFNMKFKKLNSAYSFNDDYINIVECDYRKNMGKFNRYYSYLKEKNEKPDEESILYKDFRNFMYNCNINDRIFYYNKINDLGFELTNEELFFINRFPLNRISELSDYFDEKRKKMLPFDEIDEFVFRKVEFEKINAEFDPSGLTDEEIRKHKRYVSKERRLQPEYVSIDDVSSKLKDDVISEIVEMIRKDPSKKVNYDDYILSDEQKKNLEKTRKKLFYKKVVSYVIKKMESENKPYSEILSDIQIKNLGKAMDYLRKNGNITLVNELKNLNEKIKLKSCNIDVNGFINEYMMFIEVNRRIPSSDGDIREKALLENRDKVLKILNNDEKERFQRMVLTRLNKLNSDDFFENFINFITDNQRFPSSYGDSEWEVELAKKYSSSGSKFTKEQKQKVNQLLRMYQKNTVEYVKKKRGK